MDSASLGSTASLPASLVDELAADSDQAEPEAEAEAAHDSLLRPPSGVRARARRSSSLDELVSSGFVHLRSDGRRVLVSRGWPDGRRARARGRGSGEPAQGSLRLLSERAKRRRVVRRSETESALSGHQKQRLLLDFLTRSPPRLGQLAPERLHVTLGNEKLIESALRVAPSVGAPEVGGATRGQPSADADAEAAKWARRPSRPIVVHYQVASDAGLANKLEQQAIRLGQR